MRLVPVLLTFMALLLSGAPARGQMGCAAALTFSDSGALTTWNVCRDEVRESFADPGSGRLTIELSLNGNSFRQLSNWRRKVAGFEEDIFVAEDTSGSIRVTRTYRRVSNGVLEHHIQLTNVTTQPLSGVRLRMSPGGPLRASRAQGKSFADYVYNFHRTIVEGEDRTWLAPSPGETYAKLALIARHRALLLHTRPPDRMVVVSTDSIGVSETPEQSDWLIELPAGDLAPNESKILVQDVSALRTSAAELNAAGYPGLIYSHLWWPLGTLSEAIETGLNATSRITGAGAAVILLALLVRFITLPVSLWAARQQRTFAAVGVKIKPEIARIRASYKGAEQSEKILELYRENSISPLTGLKGSVALFVQIPFLLAVFHVTTCSSLFLSADFLWIRDLALPDAAAKIPVDVFLVGDQLNLLPISMGLVFLVAGHLSTAKSSLGTLTVFTVLIVVVFYSFASALVLYWMTANAFQIAERLMFPAQTEDGAESSEV